MKPKLGTRLARRAGPGGLSWLATTFLRILAPTWRIRTVNSEPYERERARGRSVVLVLWHGTMLPLLSGHR